MREYFLKTVGLLFNRLVAFEANQGVTSQWLPDVKHTTCRVVIIYYRTWWHTWYWLARSPGMPEVLGSNRVGGVQVSVLTIDYHRQ